MRNGELFTVRGKGEGLGYEVDSFNHSFECVWKRE